MIFPIFFQIFLSKEEFYISFRLSRYIIYDENEMESVCGENRYSIECFPCCKTHDFTGKKPLCDCSRFKAKSDCLQSEHKESGLHRVKLNNGRVIDVFCDHETDKGGWIVMQRRINGNRTFYEDWANYKNGFGKLSEEFWIGNENLYYLTNQNSMKNELRVELEDWEGNKVYAKYSNFRIGNEDDGYKLYINGYHGDAGDGLIYHNAKLFSTYDVDNDDFERKCATECKGISRDTNQCFDWCFMFLNQSKN